MQTHGRPEEHVRSGSRVALNISGVEVSEVKRGQALVAPETLTAVTIIDVETSLLYTPSGVKHRSRVHFHAFTSDTLATVSLYGYDAVEPGTDRFMRLRFDTPVVLLPGDRFVLRQCSPAATIGGGRVLDAHPLSKLSKAKCLTWLKALKEASLEEQLFVRVARRGTVGITMRHLMTETGLTHEAIDRVTEPFFRGNRLLRITNDILLSTQALATAMDNVTSRLKSDGIKRSELRGQSALNPEIFDFVIENLAREKRLRLQDERVFLPGRESHLANEDLKRQAAIASIYEAAGLASPAASEVAAGLGLKEADMRRLMTLLLRDKILVKMGTDELYIHNRALEELRAKMGEFRGQRIDVARFKQITGLSRKYAIPLLEYLDRQRITRKDNDQRLVL
jgi:selenocysteine-specific elongation factor